MNSKVKRIHFFNSSIIKIVKPIWYFNIFLNNSKSWINYKNLDKTIIDKLDICHDYNSRYLKEIDVGYQLLKRGFITQDYKNYDYINLEDANYDITIKDQYIFIRRMYKKIWVYYVLLLRILSLKVQMDDFYSIFKTKNIKKLQFNNPINYQDYNSFKSKLIKKKPLISIIIPTLNRYKYLKSVILDLQKQNYKNFELIIIDQSKPFRTNFYKNYQLKIKVIQKKNRALWSARNLGIRNSSGDFFLFLDDDSIIGANWVSDHLKCIDYFDADISAGISISKIGAPVPSNYNYFRTADQLDTGNVLIKKHVFEMCGLFDLQFEKMRMGDGEFGLRAHLKGFKSIHNPLSKRTHLKVKKGGLREMGSWDGLRPMNLLSLRPIPSVLYFYRKYWGDTNAFFSLLQTIPFSLSPYRIKGRLIGYLFSIVVFILFHPIIIYKVYQSWKFSEKMLKSESIIDDL